MPLVPLTTVAVLKRRALREGVFGGSWQWRLVAVVVFGLPLLRRAMSKEAEVVLIEELRAGDRMVITPIAAPSRRERRRARRRADHE